MEGLNDFSRRFASVLFAAHPEWTEFASIDINEGIDEGSLLVEVHPARPRDIKQPLHISTESEEITVGFDIYHTHFNRYAGDNEAATFAESLAFIADVLRERIAVITWWNGDEWRGSSTLATGAEIGPPTYARNAKTARVRSWVGTHDRDIEL